jgi:hypothetical protein
VGRRNFHGKGLLVGSIVVEELPSTVIELSRFVLVNIPQKKCGKFTLPLMEQRKDLDSSGSAELEPTADIEAPRDIEDASSSYHPPSRHPSRIDG